jgi:peptidoglycan/LPS O-acetylase OafA/YrhL
MQVPPRLTDSHQPQTHPATTFPASRGPARVPQLDALRGIACLMVLIPHLRGSWGLGSFPDLVAAAGVGLFFVLSGFLITRNLIHDKQTGRGLGSFYNRRAARILPVYYLTLATILLFWPGRELPWVASFTYNLKSVSGSRDYFHTDALHAPVGHFWSLCVEEHFYWVWPILVLFLPRPVFRWVPVLIILATPFFAYELLDYYTSRNFAPTEVEGLVWRHTATQMTAISLGALLAIYEDLAPKILCGAGLIAIAAFGWFFTQFLAVRSLAWQPSFLHLFCAGTFMLALLYGRLARARYLSGIGKISYGLYLYHLPIYAAFGLASPRGVESPMAMATALVLTFAVAFISFRFLEAPILHWSQRQGPSLSRMQVYSLGSLATALIAASAVWNLLPTPPPIHSAANEVAMSPSPEQANVHTMVLGSSQALLGIAPPYMSGSVWNFANMSQDLYYDSEILKKVAPKLPRLEKVVFTISYFSLQFALSDSETEGWREALYYHQWGIPSRLGNADPRRYDLAATAGQSLHNTLSSCDPVDRGWQPMDEVIFDPESGKAAMDRHTNGMHAGLEPVNLEILNSVVSFCRERHLKLIFVTTPHHACYRRLADPGILQANERDIRSLDTPYINYFDDARFLDGDFVDGDHLNKGGAIRFSQVLSKALQ